jgi:hypothetical protein
VASKKVIGVFQVASEKEKVVVASEIWVASENRVA